MSRGHDFRGSLYLEVQPWDIKWVSQQLERWFLRDVDCGESGQKTHQCGYSKKISCRDKLVNSCTDQWAALLKPFRLVWNEYHLLRELCSACLIQNVHPGHGRVPTRKLARHIRRKLRFTFAFLGRSIKLWSNRQRFNYFLGSLDEFQSYKSKNSNNFFGQKLKKKKS